MKFNPRTMYKDSYGNWRYRDSGKTVARGVMERKFGNRLYSNQVVHHKDRNKNNNHPDNLWVFNSQDEHDRTHKKDAKKYGKSYSYKGRKRRGYDDW